MKMDKQIIIFSERMDMSTSIVIKWISYLGEKVFRINKEESIHIKNLSSEKLVLQTPYKEIEIQKNDICWFRRAAPYSIYIQKETSKEEQDIESFHFLEKKEAMESIIYWILKNCKHIDNPFFSDVNKIEVLDLAKEFKIKVPEWILTHYKDEAIYFAKQYDKIITKTFTPFSANKEGIPYNNYTSLISLEELKKMPWAFPIPAFFQRYISKKYELRIFFLNGKSYSMAIFSQQNAQTRVDFRRYDIQRPNRTAPFTLPAAYEEKLGYLMTKLNINTASVDVLVDSDDEYYFLEVNPVGQFGMTSIPCNYYIEKAIAKSLIQLKYE